MSRLTTAARRRPPAGRRGTILIVVLALLAIFAVVGIAFVFYSDGEALAARYHRESETQNGNRLPGPPDFDGPAQDALAKLIFGDTTNPLNSLRGHDLLTAIYGGLDINTGSRVHEPYAGYGIFHEKLTAPFDTNTSRGHVVNYTPLNLSGKYYSFDPEVSGPPRDLTANTANDKLPTTQKEVGDIGRTYVSKAAGYTYPDLNNFYLASVVPGTGEVFAPSFYRPWHFNANNPNVNRRLEGWNPGDAQTQFNTDWVTAEGRLKTIRPRPADQLDAAELASLPNGRLPTAAELSAAAYPRAVLYDLIDRRIRDTATGNTKGPIIGYPRPNQDGNTTGDVQNMLGGVRTQQNDSILVDFGAPSFEWPAGSGRFVKPLAAVLISDLDGLLNLNAHGNVRSPSGNHLSFHGLGPWEVNLAGAIGNVPEGNELVKARYGSTGTATARNGATTLKFDPSGVRFGAFAQVNWDGGGTATKLRIPAFGTGVPNHEFAVAPDYGTGFYDDNTNAGQAANHPALYNPAHYPAFPESQALNPLPGDGRTYSIDETRRLRQRYAGEYDLYRQTAFARLQNAPAIGQQNTIVGNGASFPPGKATSPGYRDDPAHSRRLMVTTLSADLDRARLMPLPGTGPTLTTGHVHALNTNLTNALAAGGSVTGLPPVDVNRPLADYRDLAGGVNVDTTTTPPTSTPQPLAANNMGNKDAAAADRQNLAHDIFARLLVATGAKATVTPGTGEVNVTAGVNSDEFNAVRYLAQLAANIVDYVDTDDVMTTFVFRPSGGGSLAHVDATSQPTTVSAALGESKVGDYVVFGHEQPRLVINEVYCEIVNDKNGKGMGKGMMKGKKDADKDGHVRFWVELVNPTNAPYPAGTGPLGDGSAKFADGATVRPYKLVIARNRNAGGGDNADVRLAAPDNVAGDLAAGHGDIDYDFRDAGAKGVKNTAVLPNKGVYDPGTTHPDKGFVIVGPEVTGAQPGEEYDPRAGGMPAAPWDTMIVAPERVPGMPPANPAMEYLISDADVNNVNLKDPSSPFRRHVVLLRRLANPYLDASADNPYVTVDVMDHVPANDAVVTGNGGGMMNGGVPLADRVAVGRVQPYAAHAEPDTAAMGSLPAYTFPTSFLLAQTTPGSMTQPRHTLGRHNGDPTAPTGPTFTAPAALTGTLMAPFDWFVHLDRPLINEMELLHVQAVKPHLVTRFTFQPPVATGQSIRRDVGLAPWFGVSNASMASEPPIGTPEQDGSTGRPAFKADAPQANATNLGLYRAFEVLRSKSRVYGTATGGRVHGKVNLNTIQDARVLVALLDPQPASVFKTGDVYDAATPTNPATIWGQFIKSRTAKLDTRLLADNSTKVDTTIVGKTIDDDPYDTNWNALDRPFKSFGVAEAGPPSGTIVGGGSETRFGPGLQDTILRVRTDTGNERKPMLFNYGTDATHPYLNAEPLRKLLANTTTVSNVFSVHVTIVFHNVRVDTATGTQLNETIPNVGTRGLLGPEAFREVPGDMRRQYFAVVDRSNAMVNDVNASNVVTRPFQAATKSAVQAGASAELTLAHYINATTNGLDVLSDGDTFRIRRDTEFFIGTGAAAQKVRVTADLRAPNTMAGETDYYLPIAAVTGNLNYHPPGSLISNGVSGRPSRPSPFTPLVPTQKSGIVPYCERLPH